MIRLSTRPLAGPLDWEQWQGPAPRRALDPARFHIWRDFSDYGGGVMAEAMIQGLINNKAITPEGITVAEPREIRGFVK